MDWFLPVSLNGLFTPFQAYYPDRIFFGDPEAQMHGVNTSTQPTWILNKLEVAGLAASSRMSITQSQS